MKLEKHIEITSSTEKLVDVLASAAELSKGNIKQAMTKGSVWLSRKDSTQRVRRADKSLLPGDKLHLYYDEDILNMRPENAVMIVDEGQYSIWHKPYGMLCQGSKWGDHCTINRWVENNLKPQRSAFIVHRLDRAATGLMIIAHNKKIAAYFSKLFQNRKIEKHYQAIVYGEFPQEKKLDSEIDNKSALSHVIRLKYNAWINQSLIDISIETGRKHQIRRHLSDAGFPILGDRLYGKESDKLDKDLCLVSCYLSFVSPIDDLEKTYTLADEFLPNFA